MYNDHAKLANSTLVPETKKDVEEHHSVGSVQRPAQIGNTNEANTPVSWKVRPNGVLDPSLTSTSKLILQSAIRNSTKRKYKTYWNYWEEYCQCNQLKLPNISAANIINFLSSMYDKGASYSVIKSAKSALSHKYSIPPYTVLGEHPDMKKFMQGVFNLRPPKTKTGFIWDVKILFDHFNMLGENATLNDTDLTEKTLCLLLLLSGTRMNSVFNFNINEIKITNVGITINPSAVLKHSRQNRKMDVFYYKEFTANDKLCVVKALTEYTKRRANKVDAKINKLFITNKKPYHSASIDTMRNWIKKLFKKAGIHNFSAHSCRSASTSKAAMLKVNLDDLLKMASWSNVNTFRTYYQKEIKDLPDLNIILEK